MAHLCSCGWHAVQLTVLAPLGLVCCCSYCEAICDHKLPPAPDNCTNVGGRWLYTSRSGEQSKYTIAQVQGQCNLTVSGGCAGCGPGPPGTPPGWTGPSPGEVGQTKISWIVRPSAAPVVGEVGMHGKLRQIKWVGGASNLGVWVDCKTLPKLACDM